MPKMLTLKVAPVNVVKTRTGRERNNGGRPIEGPDGSTVQPGETFEAPQKWLDTRTHWHFLELVKSKSAVEVALAEREDQRKSEAEALKSEAEARRALKSEGADPTAALERAVEEEDYVALGRLLKPLVETVPASKDDRLSAAREFLAEGDE